MRHSQEAVESTILIVDDQPEQLDIIKNFLRGSFKVKIATKGDIALKIVEGGGIDLILLDIIMPGMSGYEVCRQLKSSPATREIPIIFLTIKSEEEDEELGLEVGAVDFIRKPSSPAIVLARSRNILALRHAQDELIRKNDALQQAIKIRCQAEENLAATNQELLARNARLENEINQREQTEKAFILSEARFRGAFEAAAHGMALVSTHGKFLKVNQALCDIVGYGEEELLNTDFQSLSHPDDRDVNLTYVKQILAGTIPTYKMEKRYFHKDGHVVWGLLSVSLVRDSEKNPVYYVSHIQDITARKIAEVELQAANKELEAFVFSVSHDLRAPLRAISGFSQALMEDYREKLEGEALTYLGLLQQSSQEMGCLIDGLLHISRITRGKMTKEAVDLSALADKVIEALRQTEPNRPVTMTIAPHMVAYGDRHLLAVVVENLLNNAWKYSSKTTQTEIGFAVEMQGGMKVFRVYDNGVGFDMSYADQLFTPFQRLHRTSEFPGDGIGLATVQRIIRRHGGNIWAEAQVGKGASFFFTLPAVRTF